MTNETAIAGPVTSPAVRAVMVKMPAPISTATPKIVRSSAPSSRRSLLSGSSVSAIDCSTDFVRKRLPCLVVVGLAMSGPLSCDHWSYVRLR
jgi:hypothetical protein